MRIVFVFCIVLLAVVSCADERPELPDKGAAVADSLHGSVVVRITDKDIDGYSGNGIQNEYARADAWNADGSYLVLRGNDGVPYLYRGTDYQLVQDLSWLVGGQELEPRWDATDPSRFFWFSGTALVCFSVSADTGLVVHDFLLDFPGMSFVTTAVEGDASLDRRYWCLMVCDSAFGLMAVCVYDRTLDSVVGLKTSFPGVVNHVTMDASGEHAVICYDTMPMQSFHRDFSHQVDFPHGAAGHSDIAQTADGRDVMVLQNVATDSISMIDLETGVETGLQAIPFDVNPDIGMHISGNCSAKPGWVLVSTYGAENPPAGSVHSWMDNLLYMLELKPNPRIVRLAQTRCYTGVNPRSNYFAEAFASINRGGTKLVFGSNRGRYSPEDYTDAYEVRLPANWDQ